MTIRFKFPVNAVVQSFQAMLPVRSWPVGIYQDGVPNPAADFQQTQLRPECVVLSKRNCHNSAKGNVP